MNADTRKRIESLLALDDDDLTLYEIAHACIKEYSFKLANCEFRNFIIGLLERSDTDEWTDEQLSEYGLIRLPRDRDGEFIRIEDDVFDDDGRPCVVTGVWVTGDGISLVTCAGDGRGTNRAPQTLTHRPPVTVESVLREFANEVYTDAGNEIRARDFLCAKYAKRLRLAKEDE